MTALNNALDKIQDAADHGRGVHLTGDEVAVVSLLISTTRTIVSVAVLPWARKVWPPVHQMLRDLELLT